MSFRQALAWDTSSKAGCITAFKFTDSKTPPTLVAELVLNIDSHQSEQLLWGIDQILRAANWNLKDIHFLGVGIGPGSFTGLRIGITTARTLSQTLNIPILPVSSLEILGYPFLNRDLNVIVSTDAAKGELFLGYQKKKSKRWREVVLSPSKAALVLRKELPLSKEKWIIVGEAANRYPEFWDEFPQRYRIHPQTPFHAIPQPRVLAQLCWSRYSAKKLLPFSQVYPNYLRASDAELKLKAGLLKKPCFASLRAEPEGKGK